MPEETNALNEEYALDQEAVAVEECKPTAKEKRERLLMLAKEKKRQLLIAGTIIAALLIAASIYMRATVFDRAVHAMLEEYPYADNRTASDGSYVMIDTNPYDVDADEVDAKTERDSLSGIKFMNERLGFSAAVWNKMLQTTAMMGRQSEENSRYQVSWSYHPDRGLEVMYEKK